jgi:hypothetical protein
MSLVSKLRVSRTKTKPRVRCTWDLLTGKIYVIQPKPQPKPVLKEFKLARPPVVGQQCDKCNGTQTLVYTLSERHEACHWCTDGRGTISINDYKNYKRRLDRGLPIDYRKTAA